MSKKYCGYCMSPLVEGERFCSVCGHEVDSVKNYVHQLEEGAILNGRYTVGRVLGSGGFGITYIGRDIKLDMKVAIKEYYPSSISSRTTDISRDIIPNTSDRSLYDRGKERFLREARIMAKLVNEQGIVGVRDYFEENNTCYIVMDFIDGISLKQYIKQNGCMSVDEMIRLMVPVMISLDRVHKAGIVHRDISPDNIMITKEGEVRLLDFGAAREASRDEEQTATVILKAGFAPVEQYSGRSNLGPWTDEYALATTMYACITGVVAQISIERALQDNVRKPSAMGIKITQTQEAALMRAMSVRQEDRFPDVKSFMDALTGKISPYAPRPNASQAPVRQQVTEKKQSSATKKILIAVAIVAVIGIVAIGGVVIANSIASKSDSKKAEVETEDVLTTEAEKVDKKAEEKKVEADKKESETEAEENAAVSVKFSKDSGSTQESATVTGTSENGEVLWTYQTGSYDKAQVERINDLGENAGYYYICEAGTVIALDCKDGSVVWKNDGFGGAALSNVFGLDGKLYLCGYFGPDLYVLDRKGNEVKKIDRLYPDITNAYKIEMLGDKLAVTMENIGGQETTLYVKLDDYSVSLNEDGSTAPSAAPVSMAAVTGVSASSYLEEPQYGLYHTPDLVMDGTMDGAWVEGVGGNGEGQYLTFTLNGEYLVSGFTIYAGHQESQDLYSKNSRPASMTITFSDGSSTQVTLADSFGAQSISFAAPVKTSSVTFTIDSVYAGYKYDDTVISELSLY